MSYCTNDEATPGWVWEYCDPNTGEVRTRDRWDSLEELKTLVAECFADYRYEEVERKGIWGTSILVNRYGVYKDTGHWVHRVPVVRARPVAVRRRRPRAAWREG